MRFLKTNTATRITVGPFFDKTDGITPETAITVTSCKLTLMVDNGGVPTLVLDTAPTASGGANDMVHVTGDDAGFYDLELAAGNVNYVGRAMLAITDAAVHCPVFHEFMILPANVYDSLVLGTDTLQADVTQWLGTAAATPTVAGVPEVDITHISGSAVSTSTAQLGVNAVQAGGTAWGSGAITAASIANGAIDAATFAADVDAEILSYLVDDATRIDASALNTHSAITAAGIADAVWDEDATAHQTQGTFGQAIGDPGADTDTIWGLANTNLNATVGSRASQTSVDTIDDLLDTEIPALTTELAKVPKSDSNVSWNATALAAIQSEANDALVAYDPPTKAELDSAVAPLALEATLATVDNLIDTEISTLITMLTGIVPVNGTIGATGNSTTALHLDGIAWADDGPNSMLLTIQDVSTGLYYSRWIEDFATTGDIATVATLPFTPEASVDKYWLTPVRADVTGGSGLDAAGVRAAIGLASANLDTQLTAIDDYLDTEVAAIKAKTDNLPAAPAATGDIPSAATIADAVWDEDATAHQTQGTFGQAIGDPAADTDTIYALANTIAGNIGTPSNLGGGATIAANLSDIEGQTDDIGVAGAGLTAIPWNAAWDAEVESEANDALVAYDPPTKAELDSAVAPLALEATLATVDNLIDTEISTLITMLTGIVPVNGTIGATGNSTTALHLDGLAWADDGPNSMLLTIQDVSTGLYYSRWIEDFATTGDLATVATLPFTPEASVDKYWLTPVRADVTGGSGLDAAGVRAAIGLASANLDTQLDALPTAAENRAEMDSNSTQLAAIVADTNELQTDDYPTTLATLATAAELAKVPKSDGTSSWNATALAAIQSEANDALVANRLDELMNADSDIDGAAPPTVGSVIHELMSKTAGSFTYDQTTDSLEAVRDKLTDIETDTAEIGVAGAGLTEAGGTGDHLTAVPWNAAWDAEVQSEVTDALNAYDPPTKTEMDTAFTEIKGATWDSATDTLEHIRNKETDIETDTADLQSRVPAALVGGRIDATVDATGMETGAIDAILTRAMTESYNTDGSTMTVAQALYLISQRLTEFAISGTTVTVKKLDGSTTALTLTLDDATSPTSSTRAS